MIRHYPEITTNRNLNNALIVPHLHLLIECINLISLHPFLALIWQSSLFANGCAVCIYLNHHQHHSHFGTSPKKKYPFRLTVNNSAQACFNATYKIATAIDQYNATLVCSLFPHRPLFFYSPTHPRAHTHTHASTCHTIFNGHHSFYSTFIILSSWWKCRKQQIYLFRWPPLHFIWLFTNHTIKYYSRYYCSSRSATYIYLHVMRFNCVSCGYSNIQNGMYIHAAKYYCTSCCAVWHCPASVICIYVCAFGRLFAFFQSIWSPIISPLVECVFSLFPNSYLTNESSQFRYHAVIITTNKKWNGTEIFCEANHCVLDMFQNKCGVVWLDKTVTFDWCKFCLDFFGNIFLYYTQTGYRVAQ